MMMILLVFLLSCFGYVVVSWPEYSFAWALINTIPYIAHINNNGFKDIADVGANILAWFIAPFLFFRGV